MLGWTVLNNLKLDPATRHIPVQILSVEEERQHGLSHGAFSYLVKPATTEDLERRSTGSRHTSAPHKKRLLVVEDNDIERAEHRRAARSTTTSRWRPSAPASKRSSVLHEKPFDCCVVDLRLPDMTGFELLERMQSAELAEHVPVVVFTGKELTPSGRRSPAHRGQEHRPQGRPVAGAAARRDRAVPAPRRLGPAPSRSGGCSNACTGRTRFCAAARCWWSTTTRGTSSRSRPCSRTRRWTC